MRVQSLWLLMLMMVVAPSLAWFFDDEETVVTATGPLNVTCQSLARVGNCEFLDCFERRFPCGESYYVKQFASKYCKKFFNATARFDQAGQRFLESSRLCVILDLLQHYGSDQINCDTLESAAVTKIAPCYLDNGFCAVIEANTGIFVDVFEIADASTFMGPLNTIGNTCGASAMANLLRALTTQTFSRWFDFVGRK